MATAKWTVSPTGLQSSTRFCGLVKDLSCSSTCNINWYLVIILVYTRTKYFCRTIMQKKHNSREGRNTRLDKVLTHNRTNETMYKRYRSTQILRTFMVVGFKAHAFRNFEWMFCHLSENRKSLISKTEVTVVRNNCLWRQDKETFSQSEPLWGDSGSWDYKSL